MIGKSTLFSAASGSLGGLVFQRGRGCLVIKSKSKPVNKQSVFQGHQRQIFSSLMHRWSVLGVSTKAGWQKYADHIARSGETGFKIKSSGRDHFIRCNLPRRLYKPELPALSSAPTTLNLGAPPNVTNPAGYIDANGQLQLTGYLIFQGLPWVQPTQHFYLVKATSGCEASVVRRRKPYQYFVAQQFDTQPVNPYPMTVAIDWPPWMIHPSRGPYDFCHAGTRIFISISLSYRDGRLSMPFEYSVISPTHS